MDIRLSFCLFPQKRKSKCRISILRNCSHHRFGNGRNSINVSRSTYSRLLPKDSMDNTTYFSFYDVLEKIAIILGTFIFALLIDNYDAIRLFFLQETSFQLPTTSGMRFAALSMSVFFALGLFFIRFLKFNKISDKETL